MKKLMGTLFGFPVYMVDAPQDDFPKEIVLRKPTQEDWEQLFGPNTFTTFADIDRTTFEENK